MATWYGGNTERYILRRKKHAFNLSCEINKKWPSKNSSPPPPPPRYLMAAPLNKHSVYWKLIRRRVQLMLCLEFNK